MTAASTLAIFAIGIACGAALGWSRGYWRGFEFAKGLYNTTHQPKGK